VVAKVISNPYLALFASDAANPEPIQPTKLIADL